MNSFKLNIRQIIIIVFEETFTSRKDDLMTA